MALPALMAASNSSLLVVIPPLGVQDLSVLERLSSKGGMPTLSLFFWEENAA